MVGHQIGVSSTAQSFTTSQSDVEVVVKLSIFAQ